MIAQVQKGANIERGIKSICLSLSLCFSSLFALPSGGKVVGGDASILPILNPALLEVQANGKAIVHWKQFDIASKETVRFLQSQSKSAILNRVTEGSASQILGQLQANCPIYLINGQGVFVGTSAHIDTAGFIASTADISDASFFSDDEIVFNDFGQGSIVNLGNISSSEGYIALIARSIDNQGSIESPQGSVALYTSEVAIHPHSKKNFFIRLGVRSDEEKGIENSGTIQALEVAIKTQSVHKKAIHHTGKIEALNPVEKNGKIYLVASQGELVVDGALLAESGRIEIFGNDTAIEDHARIDVSGPSGGVILIGQKGLTTTLNVASSAQMKANGTVSDGGTIDTWADHCNHFHGIAEAKALGPSGNGGMIEVSSADEIWVSSHPDLRSNGGKDGVFICDPGAVTIDNSNMMGPDTFGSLYINMQLTLGSLSISTAGASAGSETLTVLNTVTGVDAISWNTANSLDLTGRTNVVIQPGAQIQATGSGSLTIDANTMVQGGVFTGMLIGAGALLSTNSGALSLTGTGNGGGSVGIFINGATVTTQTGQIIINGTGGNGTSGTMNAYGIFLNNAGVISSTGSGTISLTGNTQGNGSFINGITISDLNTTVSSSGGAITFNGTASGNTSNSYGIWITSQAAVSQSGGSDITLIGNGGGGSSGVTANYGVHLNGGASIQSTGSGGIALTGTGTSNGNLINGITISDLNTTISSSGGSITLNGTGRGNTGNSYGVWIASQAVLTASNNADISITGNGGGGTSGTTGNFGIFLNGGGVVQSIGSGGISLIGTGTSNGNFINGITISDLNTTISSSGGSITLNGTARGNTGNNYGIWITAQAVVTASNNSNIGITGTGGPGTTGTANNYGVHLNAGGIVSSTGTGTISLTGTGQGNGSSINGIVISDLNTTVSSSNVSITLTGTAGGNNSNNYGVWITSQAVVTAAGNADIIINGQGGGGISPNYGIYISSNGQVISTGTGNIQMSGAGGVVPPQIGIALDSGGNVTTSMPASGNISLSSPHAVLIQNSGNVQTLGTGGPNLNAITVTCNDLSILGGGLGSSFISTVRGNISVSSSDSVTINQGIIESTMAGNISLSALNLFVEGGSVIGTSGIQTQSGDINVVCEENCQYNAPNMGAQAVMRTFGSDLTVTAGGSIILSGFSIFSTPAPGHLALIAGVNIELLSLSTVTALGNANSSLTMIVDNNFPTSPGIGPGQFIIESGAIVSAGGPLAPVKIYTADFFQNTVNVATINSAPWNPGPLFVDSSFQEWNVYALGGSYGGYPFKFYYKNFGIPQADVSLYFQSVMADWVELADLLPVLKAPHHPHRFPTYHFQVCKRKSLENECDPVFSPYGSFIFEDDLYWIENPGPFTYENSLFWMDESKPKNYAASILND